MPVQNMSLWSQRGAKEDCVVPLYGTDGTRMMVRKLWSGTKRYVTKQQVTWFIVNQINLVSQRHRIQAEEAIRSHQKPLEGLDLLAQLRGGRSLPLGETPENGPRGGLYVPTLWGGGLGERPEGVPPVEEPQAKELCAGPPCRSRLCQRSRRNGTVLLGGLRLGSPVTVHCHTNKQTWLPCLAHGPCRVKHSLYIRCDFHRVT
jgi:hypothetical protein